MKKGQRLIDVRDSELGLLIKAMRLAKGLTQEQLAKRVGLERTSICNMELGNQVVLLTNLVATGDICGFEVRLTVDRKARRAKNKAPKPENTNDE